MTVATKASNTTEFTKIKTITDLTSRSQINKIEFIDDRGLLLLYLNGIWSSFNVPTSPMIPQTYLAVKINGCLAMMIDTKSNSICANPIENFLKQL